MRGSEVEKIIDNIKNRAGKFCYGIGGDIAHEIIREAISEVVGIEPDPIPAPPKPVWTPEQVEAIKKSRNHWVDMEKNPTKSSGSEDCALCILCGFKQSPITCPNCDSCPYKITYGKKCTGLHWGDWRENRCYATAHAMRMALENLLPPDWKEKEPLPYFSGGCPQHPDGAREGDEVVDIENNCELIINEVKSDRLHAGEFKSFGHYTLHGTGFFGGTKQRIFYRDDPHRPKIKVKEKITTWLNLYPNGIASGYSAKENADYFRGNNRIGDAKPYEYDVEKEI